MSSNTGAYLDSESFLQYNDKIEKIEGKDNQILQMPKENKPGVKETLNAMFKPKEWEEAGREFIQYVSEKEATRENAKELFNALISKLKERQAREKGICPVREEIYSQCFDEIIRQVTIDSPERGLLLLKVRDEIKMSIASYQMLYESSILYGIRKRLQIENGKEELNIKYEQLKKKKIELINRKLELRNKLSALRKQLDERNEVENQRRAEDIKFLEDRKARFEKSLLASK